TLDNAPDPADARLRLRATLRHMIDSIWLLVVPRGFDRLAAVQIWFAGCKRRRDYLILHMRTRANGQVRTPGDWRVWSLADVVEEGDLDLRDRADAEALEGVLAGLDLDRLGK